MAGTAVLGTSLVDDLIPRVDELRRDLHADFGVRQYRVYTVKRVWSESRRGAGDALYVNETELIPAPRIDWGSLKQTLSDIGVDEDGSITLHEVSLTYTESELNPSNLAANEEFFFKVVDGLGQGIAARYFTPQDRPVPDREHEIGWVVTLRHSHFEAGGGL